MKAILTAFLWEIKTSWMRNSFFMLISLLLVYFGEFTDFPFTQDQSEPFTGQALFYIYLISHLVLLAVFRGAVLKDMDSREFFSQCPVNYKSHFIGKCLAVSLLILCLDLLSYLISLGSEHYFGNSLGAYSASDEIDAKMYRQPLSSINSVFSAGLILFAAVFKPLHFAVLIALLSAMYGLANAHPEAEKLMPLFTEETQTALLWMFVPWLLGMFLYEWRMTRSPAMSPVFRLPRVNWLKKLHVNKSFPVLLTLACLGAVIYKSYSQSEDKTLATARDQLWQTVSQLKSQDGGVTRAFNFSFDRDHQWIYKELSGYADLEWRQLQDEFGIQLGDDGKIDVFIKDSDEHTLGSTRGSFIIINADTIKATVNKSRAIRKTFRHELTHVIINRLSDYQFINKEDIFSGFFHEGLAELAEGHWDTNNAKLNRTAALHYVTYAEELSELLPKLERFGKYDYELNYGLGYVFWGEFVKLYGRNKIKLLLWQLAEEQDEDKKFTGIQYLFHKASAAGIDLFKLLQASKKTMAGTYARLEKQMMVDTSMLKDFKAVRLDKGNLLIPFMFSGQVNVFCKFREKETTRSLTVKLLPFNYQGNTGGVCHVPETESDEVRLALYFPDGVEFITRWIAVPRK